MHAFSALCLILIRRAVPQHTGLRRVGGMYFLVLEIVLPRLDVGLFCDLHRDLVVAWEKIGLGLVGATETEGIFRLYGGGMMECFMSCSESSYEFVRGVVTAVRCLFLAKYPRLTGVWGLGGVRAIRNEWCPAEYRIGDYCVLREAVSLRPKSLLECTYEGWD